MEKETRLKAYKEEINILELTIDIPYFDNLEDRLIYGTYENTLLKLFNNKRENKDEILEIRNYYGSNKITMVINLDAYRQGSYNSEEEDIEHLKRFMIGSFDMKSEDIKEYKHKGYLYTINDYENGIDIDDYVVVNEW